MNYNLLWIAKLTPSNQRGLLFFYDKKTQVKSKTNSIRVERTPPRRDFFVMVEFSRLAPNPHLRDWRNARSPIVSNSEIRQEAARFIGIPVLTIPSAQARIAESEKRTQEKVAIENNGFTAVLPFRRSRISPPLMVELSLDKLMGLNESLVTTPMDLSSVTVIDSVWAVDPTPDHLENFPNSDFIIQKPVDERGRRAIFDILTQGIYLRAHLQSISGISRIQIKPDGSRNYSAYLMAVDLGELNPDINLEKLEQRMIANGHFAGGFSTIDVHLNEMNIIIPPPYYRITIFEYADRGPTNRIVSGRLLNQRTMLELANGSENLSQLLAVSLGLI